MLPVVASVPAATIPPASPKIIPAPEESVKFKLVAVAVLIKLAPILRIELLLTVKLNCLKLAESAVAIVALVLEKVWVPVFVKFKLAETGVPETPPVPTKTNGVVVVVTPVAVIFKSPARFIVTLTTLAFPQSKVPRLLTIRLPAILIAVRPAVLALSLNVPTVAGLTVRLPCKSGKAALHCIVPPLEKVKLPKPGALTTVPFVMLDAAPTLKLLVAPITSTPASTLLIVPVWL